MVKTNCFQGAARRKSRRFLLHQFVHWDVPTVQTFSAVVHEIAHSKLHYQKKIEEPKNATKYQEVEIFDIPALFSNWRIAPADIPEGLYRYDPRSSGYDLGMPVTVEKVNHAGMILTSKLLELGDDAD